MPVLDVQGLIDDRVGAIARYHGATGLARAELDVSGGVDSAVMLLLLCRALGPERVTAVYIDIHSGPEFAARAREVAQVGPVPLVEFDASQLFDEMHGQMLSALKQAGFHMDDIAQRMASDHSVNGSIRSCLRAPIGRGFNRLTGGGVRHGTGNECEDRFIRFFQKGGDGEVDTNPIAMLTKGEVFQLGRGLGVPASILEALPSPDLHAIGEAHNDEDELREATGVHWTYSKVSSASGAYTYVGTIERMARFLDEAPSLFADATPDWDALTEQAVAGRFPAELFEAQDVRSYLESARKLEAGTRHKWNPNCPTLGVRANLLWAGLLTDELPGLSD
ncbi:MAG: NAD+ synthase [Pseudohongiellaceae bacterium]|jgi:NAD+ synthase